MIFSYLVYLCFIATIAMLIKHMRNESRKEKLLKKFLPKNKIEFIKKLKMKVLRNAENFQDTPSK